MHSAEGALTLATAGHIDHGKTALVRALTGVDTDRLAEEKRRGISIDLGFAELDLGEAGSVGVVDVPGHERLVRTMVAGAAGVDLFLLVVAADDGVMPQTREHLEALRALGVETGVVALTKCDLADDDARALAAEEVRELAPGLAIVEVSATSGAGLDELVAELRRAVSTVRPAAPEDPAPGLMHVDRAFSLRGVGTVVTGTVAAGRFAPGEQVVLLPDRTPGRIRSIQTHGRETASVARGARAAFNLAGVDRDRARRGDVLTPRETAAEPGYRLDVALAPAAGQAPPYGERVQVHHGTRDVAARVIDLGLPGLAQLRLEAPLIARAGDRCVLRRIAPAATIGGALVLDPDPRRHAGGRDADRLETVRSGDAREVLGLLVEERPEGVPSDPPAWAADPLLCFPLARLGAPAIAEAVDSLAGAGARLEAGSLLRPSDDEPEPRAITSTPAPAAVGESGRILELLAADGFEPRAPQAIADAIGVERGEAVAILGGLVEAGLAVRVKPDVYYPAEQLERIETLVARLAARRGSISISELRDDLRTSRKYSQAILEHLDGRGLTVRQGDRHVARSTVRRG